MASGEQRFIDQDGDGLVVNAGAGQPVFRMIGGRNYHWAWAAAEFPGQCLLRFAVQGTKDDHAVMTGIDQSGAEVLWLRRLERGYVEIVASPDWQLTPQALILICMVAPWLLLHFHSSGSISVDVPV